jgi:hypothetical protein
MDASSFNDSGIRRLDVEPGNPVYGNVDDFVINLDNCEIIFYCGSDAEIIIPDFVYIVGAGSFQCRESIHRVIFGPMTLISSIGSWGFYGCEHLESINFPSFMKSVGNHCFYDCRSLHSVTFESVSHLGRIQEGTFRDCPLLESICVPASMTHLGRFSFAGCRRLTMITFPAGSKRKYIGSCAFAGCCSLKSLVIPSSVEEIQSDCFEGCVSLSSLVFSSPSQLAILRDLPEKLPNFTAIPDSVKSLEFKVRENLDCGYTLIFGLDSQLEDVKAFALGRSGRRQSFIVLPSGRLKYFRTSLEFEVRNSK